MTIEKFKNLLPDFILGMLSEAEEIELRSFIQSNLEAATIYEEWKSLDEELDTISEQPSSKMDDRFYQFLELENNDGVDESAKVYSINRPKKEFGWLKAVAVAAILVVGFLIGKQWESPSIVNTEEITNSTALQEAAQETEAVRTELVISLVDQPSASKRLQALSEASKLSEATDQVINALFKMLNSDPNVNVRLAAVSALSNYVENPKVREGLVLSITMQDSPMVQIALADLMVTLKEQKSINSMETLLQKPDINQAVKQKLEESINQII